MESKNQQIENPTEAEHFTTHFVVDKTPEDVFKAVNNVKAWWSENVQGSTSQLNDEFLYHYKNVHISKMKIIELVPDKKVVWLVLENQFDFTKDKSEWKGNKIVFEISSEKGKTRLDFTQIGLVPEYECYNVCRDAWSSYIQGSLKDLVNTGKGKPNTKDNDLNKELIAKWGLPNRHDIKESFTYRFETPQSADQVYQLLLNVEQWWSGLYDEKIKGESKKTGDVFTFNAGDGVHYSKQKLIELVPGKKIVWQVTDSKLSFLKQPNEWNGTKITFDLILHKNKTEVSFTHEGLVPQIECYDQCSSAWKAYLDNLKKKLK